MCFSHLRLVSRFLAFSVSVIQFSNLSFFQVLPLQFLATTLFFSLSVYHHISLSLSLSLHSWAPCILHLPDPLRPTAVVTRLCPAWRRRKQQLLHSSWRYLSIRCFSLSDYVSLYVMWHGGVILSVSRFSCLFLHDYSVCQSIIVFHCLSI
jgi:hypothetical protein